MKHIQYIHCPKCNGIIKNSDYELSGWRESSIIMNQYPKCSECNIEYKILINPNGALKVEIVERGDIHE